MKTKILCNNKYKNCELKFSPNFFAILKQLYHVPNSNFGGKKNGKIFEQKTENRLF
jgi:hypothetical protein